ncbi:lipoprotein [Azonexus sp. R2A61]
MTRIAAVVIVLCVAACGIKGPLELPPNSGSPTATKDVSTAHRTTNR